ncbi:MAG: pyridoxamine 5-phosphate oxidase [Myxococcales bacterium]|nr:pyridoxamine 5-phosphate oxidase [Myxococcales bacterium]
MDPIGRFVALFAQARVNPCHDPTAMTLSTVGADGRPSARVVLLKGADAEGFVFYTNTRSRKGRELVANANVALTFWWPHIGWQVRVEGAAVPVGDAEADAYFATRARGSQLGAWASYQSDPLDSRAELEARLAAVTQQYLGQPVPRPAHWSGYRVAPLVVELWQNREDRLHDREEYSRPTPTAPWTMRRLNP